MQHAWKRKVVKGSLKQICSTYTFLSEATEKLLSVNKGAENGILEICGDETGF